MQIFYFYYPIIVYFFVHLIGVTKKQKEQLFLVLVSFYIFIMLSFFDMDAVPDVIYYNDAFDVLRKVSITTYEHSTFYDFEYGYLLYTKIVGYFFSSPWALYVIRAIFSACVFYYIVKRYSVNIYLTGTVFIMFAGSLMQAAFVIRQYMAIFIFLMAIPSLLEKKLIPYLIITTCSFLFHTAAIVYFPLYFLYHYFPINKWNKWFVLLVIFILATFSFTIMKSVSSFFNIFDNYYDNTDGEGLGSFGMALRALLVFAPFVFLYKRAMNDEYGRFCFLTAAISFVLAVGMWGVGSGSRLFQFYNYFSIFSIPWCYVNIRNRVDKIIYIVGLLSVFSFLVFKGLEKGLEVRYLWE